MELKLTEKICILGSTHGSCPGRMAGRSDLVCNVWVLGLLDCYGPAVDGRIVCLLARPPTSLVRMPDFRIIAL